MPHLMLSWQYALIIAGCLGAVAAASRVPRVARSWTGWPLWGGVAWEAALLFGLYALWQFAGSFTVFGHAGCAGDIGHCDVPSGPRDPFDRRPPHQLVPQTKTVIVTDALRQITGEELVISVVAVRPSADGPVAVDELFFERLALVTFD